MLWRTDGSECFPTHTLTCGDVTTPEPPVQSMSRATAPLSSSTMTTALIAIVTADTAHRSTKLSSCLSFIIKQYDFMAEWLSNHTWTYEHAKTKVSQERWDFQVFRDSIRTSHYICNQYSKEVACDFIGIFICLGLLGTSSLLSNHARPGMLHITSIKCTQRGCLCFARTIAIKYLADEACVYFYLLATSLWGDIVPPPFVCLSVRHKLFWARYRKNCCS